jgi:membrane-associated phospholipid phosphatase
MNRLIYIIFSIVFIMSIILTSCSTTGAHRVWGEDANIRPGLDRIGKSAADAALAPETWVPLATAVLIAATNSDGKIQDWAVNNTPIFGSTTNATNYSGYFVKASTWIYITSVIITPGGDQLPTWFLNKAKGLTVGVSAVLSTQILTLGIKSLTSRERPDGSDDRSFPSGHTSAVAVNTILASRNIEYLHLNPYIEKSLKIALNTMTLATGWARIEGNKHYPTDILFGAALGSFIGGFINDTFLGRYSADIKFTAGVTLKSTSLNLYIRF